MVKNKNQHIIPQCYLKSWCDPETPKNQEPYIWIFSKDGQRVRKKAPSSVFFEKDFYTITDASGNRNLTLEHGLSEIETWFSDIRRKKLQYHKPLTEDEKFKLSAFVAAMHGRTKSFIEHQKKQWKSIKSKVDQLKYCVESATPAERQAMSDVSHISSDKNDRMTYDDIAHIAENTLQVMLPVVVQEETPIYFQMSHVILETSETPGFITSDHPCVCFDPESLKRPPLMQSPGLAFPTIEVSFPISPKQLLMINHQGLSGYIFVSPRTVKEMNRRTRFYCREHFIVAKNSKDKFWFDRGIEPPDSWKNLHGQR